MIDAYDKYYCTSFVPQFICMNAHVTFLKNYAVRESNLQSAII